MRHYKATPELLVKIEKRKKIVNFFVASFIAGHAYHTYNIVQLSNQHKEQRALAEERYELLKKKFNDQRWIDGLQSKLGSLKATRQHVGSIYLSDEEIKEMEARGYNSKNEESKSKRGGAII